MSNCIFIATGFLLAMFVGIGCHKPKGEFRTDFTALVATAVTNKDPVVKIGAATGFSWDRLLIFHPYTPSSEIDRQLGYPWSHKYRIGYDVPAGVHALVFMKTGMVVCFVELPRHAGDFVGLTNGSVIMPESDSFKVEPAADMPSWFKLVSIEKN